MKSKLMLTSAVLAVVAGTAQAEDLTLCWAAWDPANALIELSKDYEAESGNKMSFEFVPWTNFADRMLNELNSGGKLCDLLIGDSQWIGGAAENGQYVKLNDFFDANGISMDAFIPATVTGYFANPAGPNGDKFAQLGGQGISVVAASEKQEAALTYIKWFAQPEVQAKWWQLGGFSALRAVVEDPGFVASAPYAQTFLDSMAIVKDFWAEPSYASLLQASQKRFHDYVVAGQGTAKEALDGLVADWTEVFEEEGKL